MGTPEGAEIYNLTDPSTPELAGTLEGLAGEITVADGFLASSSSLGQVGALKTAALRRGLLQSIVDKTDVSVTFRFRAVGLEAGALEMALITVDRIEDKRLPLPGTDTENQLESIWELTSEEIAEINETTVDRVSADTLEVFEIAFPRVPLRETKYRITMEIPGWETSEVDADVIDTPKDLVRRHRQIAEDYAPVFLQKTNLRPEFRQIDDGELFEDYFVRYDYDADWIGYNNWENLADAADEGFDLRAFVYYGVQETHSHYYVHYAYFHARDPKPDAAHENDMEGVMVVVQKGDGRPGTNRESDANRESIGAAEAKPPLEEREGVGKERLGGEVVLLQVQAHDRFGYGRPADLVNAGRGDEMAIQLAEVTKGGQLKVGAKANPELATHPVVFVEPGRRGLLDTVGQVAAIVDLVKNISDKTKTIDVGHGAELPDSRVVAQAMSGDGIGIIYVPGEVAGTPESTRNTTPVVYQLISFTGDTDQNGEQDTDADGSAGNKGFWDLRRDDRLFGKSLDTFGAVPEPSDVNSRDDRETMEFGHGLHGGRADLLKKIARFIKRSDGSGTCSANLPWGWVGDEVDGDDRGAFFLDPVGYFLAGTSRRKLDGNKKVRVGRLDDEHGIKEVREGEKSGYIWNLYLDTDSKGVRPGPMVFACDCEQMRSNFLDPSGLDCLHPNADGSCRDEELIQAFDCKINTN